MKTLFLTAIALLTLASAVAAQSLNTSLAALPEADALIYVSPQRVLNEAAPRVMVPTEYTKMRAAMADIKKSVGVDPSTVQYLVFAIRVHKPASDLSFVMPDMMAVFGGDFNADSLMTLAQNFLQDKVRIEQYGSKSIALVKVDPIVAEAEKNPILKPFTELGVVALSANSIAIGNLRYLKSAIDAAEGTGRISPATLESLLRDPNALMAASGAPITAIAKSFGLFGLENTTRESRCDTTLGNFYAAVTMSGTNFSLRGAMNADNPDTAKIIHGLVLGLMKTGIDAVPDKEAQSILEMVKMFPRESEIVLEADIPEKVVADLFRPSPKRVETTKAAAKKPVRKKRTR